MTHQIQIIDRRGDITLYFDGKEIFAWNSYKAIRWNAVWWKPWTWRWVKEFVEHGSTIAFYLQPPETIRNVSISVPGTGATS